MAKQLNKEKQLTKETRDQIKILLDEALRLKSRAEARNARSLLLEPNRGSDLKIERYTFGIVAVIDRVGQAQVLEGVNSPDVNFRPERVACNVEAAHTVYISDARVANVSFTVGGAIDAFQFGYGSVGLSLDVPTLTPVNNASFTARYTGRTRNMKDLRGQSVQFIMSFTGYATMVA